MCYKFHHHLATIDSAWIPTTANRNQIKPQKEQHTQLRQDTVHTYVILPPDHQWNSLPQVIVAAKSLDCFKSRLAAHM